MIGVLINVATVLAGSFLGLLLRGGIPERFTDIMMKGLGLCTIYIGICGALEGKNTLVLILSIVIGAVIGELLCLDDRINALGSLIERKLTALAGEGSGDGQPKRRFILRGGGKIAEAFVTSSLVFCIGAMTLVGSLNAGLTGDSSLLIAKATLDLVSSFIFASTLGAGVLLSAVFVLVYQGGIVLLAGLVSPLLSEYVIAEMTCAGSLLIIGLGFNLLGITKLKITNLLPAIFLPVLLCIFLKA
ncbi:MAG: DUF554 domain-containing protein [Clostridiales bacterium]|nr:DUF554 domain-containing protein [Clostridiales bacterium]